MKKQEMLSLCRYNAWANARILNAAADLTAEQFFAPGNFPHGGLGGTLAHLLSAEWIWRVRWEGHSPAKLPGLEEFPTFETLRGRLQEEDKNLIALVENVNEAALDHPLSYRTTSGKAYENILWHLMLHLVNHGTQHRSEAAAMLTGFGHSPGDLDLIMFLREK